MRWGKLILTVGWVLWILSAVGTGFAAYHHMGESDSEEIWHPLVRDGDQGICPRWLGTVSSAGSRPGPGDRSPCCWRTRGTGEYLDTGALTSDNQLDGEGPFRVMPPQKNPGPPGQKSTAPNVEPF